MADEKDNPTPEASGAGTKAHKTSKAEQAKLPGGADFDVDNASAEDFDKHTEILRRRQVVGSLAPQAASAAPVPVTIVDPLASAPAPAQDGITKYDRRNGNPQTLPAKAWALLLPEDLENFEDAPVQPTKPADLT